jgi:DNA (cytosine-5)-methyltransferase 1
LKPRILPRVQPLARAVHEATSVTGYGIGPHRQVTYTRVGRNRGVPRLWLEGGRLARCGFEAGAKFVAELDLVRRQVRLRLDPNGDRTVSGRKRTLTDGAVRTTPIVDVAGASLADVLGEGARLRAVLASGEIVFDLHPVERAIAARETRTREHLQAGFLTESALCAGVGVATLALKEGVEAAGVPTRVDWIIDRDGRYLDLAAMNNPAITPETRLYEASLEEVETAALTGTDLVQVSLPCAPHSLSGKAKRGLNQPEDHPTDALATVGLIRILEAVNPSAVISENVTQARDSASYALIRAYLHEQGYVIFEDFMDSRQAGTIEMRERWWMVAISQGLAEGFTMDNVPALPRTFATLGEAMDAIAVDDTRWKAFEYLEAKAIRDAAAGKGFKRQLVGEDSTQVGTIGRGYAKARSTEPFIVREDGLQRLLTPAEQARVKGIPEQLVYGASDTLAHEVLGQSILYGHALGIGMALGEHLQRVVAAPAPRPPIEHDAAVEDGDDDVPRMEP